MLEFVTSLISSVCGFLASVLPDSPFADIANGASSLGTGIGWFNWFVPVGDLILIFGAWIAALLLWAAIQWVLTKGEGIIGKVIGQ